MSTQPPRRRRRRPQSTSESDPQMPRRRKKRSGSSGKKKKSSKKNQILLLRIGLFAAAGIVLLIGIFMMDWKGIGKSLGLPSAQERLLNRVIAIKEEQADLLASIRDEASARSAGESMKDLTVQIAETMQEANDLRKDKSQNVTPEEDRELRDRFMSLNKDLDARIKQETERIMKNPSLRPIMAEVFQDARFALMEAQSEMRKKSLQAGASAPGYSAVTSWTSLSPGDDIQALHMNVNWQPGKVVEVADDGKVKVHLNIHSGINSFDQFYERDKLRIKD